MVAAGALGCPDAAGTGAARRTVSGGDAGKVLQDAAPGSLLRGGVCGGRPGHLWRRVAVLPGEVLEVQRVHPQPVRSIFEMLQLCRTPPLLSPPARPNDEEQTSIWTMAPSLIQFRFQQWNAGKSRTSSSGFNQMHQCETPAQPAVGCTMASEREHSPLAPRPQHLAQNQRAALWGTASTAVTCRRQSANSQFAQS